MSPQLLPALALCLSALLPLAARAAEPLFPFVLPYDDATPGVTNISHLLEKPAGKHGFVTARDGHLYTGDQCIRFFGVNMAFGGNFPTHADAEKVAARMAKFGINCVRFHHMDTGTAPAGLLQKDRRTFDPEALDRLDYFIAELTKNGIYTNLNLHVGNEYPGFQKWEGASGYFKGVDNFFPPFIAQQHDYARTLLTHVNPYTKLAYTADPAVAFIEINNENGLMMEWNNRTLDAMPDPYAAEFTRQWNAWLQKEYKTVEQLSSVWQDGEQPLGEEMLRTASPWVLEQHEGARATLEELLSKAGRGTQKIVEVKVEQPGAEPWHVQFNRAGLHLEAGKTYTVSFRAKSAQPRQIDVNLGMTKAPWKVLASQKVKLTPEWQKVELALNPNAADDNARISFSSLGAQPGEISFEDISLRPGGIVALVADTGWGTQPFLRKVDLAKRTVAVQKDWNRFLLDTEATYWMGMSQFIKGELGARSLVLGSATGFSPWLVQSQLDVVDAHAYWQHPHFPGRQWDLGNWTVKNESMAGRPDGGTLPGLAMRRVAGKPFIVTEYNHASPNTYSSEAFLEICAFGALQDWDGIFAFAYCHRLNDWDTKRLTSFFDIDQHPTKMATLPAAIALFYRADLAPAANAHTTSVTLQEAFESIRTGGGSWVSAKNYGIKPEEAFQRLVAMRLRQEQEPAPEPVPDSKINPAHRGLVWDAEKGRMLLDTARTAGVVGNLQPQEQIQVGGVTIRACTTQQDWATITATVMKGEDFLTARQILITATGTVENQDVGWKNGEKTTVGKDWGKTPSLVEGVSATILLPLSGRPLKAWALNEQGQRGREIKINQQKEAATLTLSPEDKTLWWEVVAE